VILVYEGCLGSGKTYTAIRDHYLPTIKKAATDSPRPIYTNIEGILDDSCVAHVSELTGVSKRYILEQVTIVQDSWFIDMANNCPDGALVIADEAHRFWCSREWRNFTDEQRNWFSESRHHKVDLIIISQTSKSIESWIIDRSEYIYTALKMSMLSMSNRYALKHRMGGSGSKSMLKPTFHKYEQRVFDAYKSFDGDEVQNLEIKQPALFGKMSYIFMFIIFPFCLWYGYHNYNNHAKPIPDNLASASQALLNPQSTITYPNHEASLQEQIDVPVVDRNLSAWVCGLVFMSVNNYIVLFRMADGRQFTSDMIGLALNVSKDGRFNFKGRFLRVGSWVGLSSYQVDRLPPVEHSTMSPSTGFNPSPFSTTSAGS